MLTDDGGSTAAVRPSVCVSLGKGFIRYMGCAQGLIRCVGWAQDISIETCDARILHKFLSSDTKTCCRVAMPLVGVRKVATDLND